MDGLKYQALAKHAVLTTGYCLLAMKLLPVTSDPSRPEYNTKKHSMEAKNDITRVKMEDKKLSLIISRDYLRARLDRTSVSLIIAWVMLIGLLIIPPTNLTAFENAVSIYVEIILAILGMFLLSVWVSNLFDCRNG